jgi:hypothetical protein
MPFSSRTQLSVQPSSLDNILPFPLARAGKEELGRRAESEGRGHHSGVIDRSAGPAPPHPRIQNGYLIIPLRGYDNQATPDGAPRERTTASSRDYSPPFNTLKSTLFVSLSRLRLLAAAIILLAMLPTLGAAAILWLGNAEPPRFLPVNASASHGAKTEAEVIITFPVISMPATFRAVAGEDTPFPLVIDGSDRVGGGSTISISRLLAGSTFSAGVPQGKTSWKLTSGEIENLHLALPKTARGERALMIQLLAPNGHVISNAATIVEVTAAPEARIPIRRVKTEVVPGDVWHESGQKVDPVPLPTRRPRLRR